MADKILLKRADTPGKAPAAGDLTPGELAVNTADGKLYTKRDNGTVKEVGGGGGLTLFEESRNTASPNATVPVHALTALGDEANIDFVIAPKGTGAILAQVPTGTTAGGNKRGNYAVDLQLQRISSIHVASGLNSFVAGMGNRASGNYSFAIGSGCAATSQNAVALGNNCGASNNYAVAMGSNCTATAPNAVAIGTSNIASATSALALGNGTRADGLRSTALGWNTTTRGTTGAVALGLGSAGLGTAQMRLLPLMLWTEGATSGVMSAEGYNPMASSIPVLPNNSVYSCRIRVIARDYVNNMAKSWSGTALIKRGANAASTTLVGSSITSDFGDSSMDACSVSLSANTTLGGLNVDVVGGTDLYLLWVAQVETVEAA